MRKSHEFAAFVFILISIEGLIVSVNCKREADTAAQQRDSFPI